MGTGIGILVMPIWLNFLISSFQWRTAYIITGGVIAACMVVGAQFLVKDPSQKRQFPDGQEPLNKLKKYPETLSMSLGQAIRTRRFITLCLAYFTVFFCTMIIIVHMVPYAIDLGHTEASSALVLAVVGGASIAGRFILGTIGDRTGSKRALLLCFMIFTLVFIWLQFAQQLWQLFLFAVVYGFAHGGFYALISPVVAEFFGLRSHGVIFGSIVLVSSVGGALGPLVAGFIFDLSSSYHAAFMLVLAFSAMGFIAILVSGSGEKKMIASDGLGGSRYWLSMLISYSTLWTIARSSRATSSGSGGTSCLARMAFALSRVGRARALDPQHPGDLGEKTTRSVRRCRNQVWSSIRKLPRPHAVERCHRQRLR
jgi:MFS family permease